MSGQPTGRVSGCKCDSHSQVTMRMHGQAELELELLRDGDVIPVPDGSSLHIVPPATC